ncbi:unannotated protein [freshwater metagenome]|uniref:Unannotated protein n=1 Tax=freshwater metagenome TaxID=449393 RepID=A0A6J6ZFU1_9ZZZZ
MPTNTPRELQNLIAKNAAGSASRPRTSRISSASNIVTSPRYFNSMWASSIRKTFSSISIIIRERTAMKTSATVRII